MNKGDIFKSLHHEGNMLVLPNVWNPLGALLLENTGYKAVATASASIAFTNGIPDGQKFPFKDVLITLAKIVNSVSIPVSADIEGAYTNDHSELKENIKQLIDTGIAGINFEDTNHFGEGLTPLNEQCKKIAIIKETATQMGVSLFINARTDVNLRPGPMSDREKLAEIINRGKAYKDAGADGFYPMLLKNVSDIEEVINDVKLPVNLLMIPGLPPMKELQKMGLARLSLGPGFLKIAMNAMKNVAEKLLHLDGMNDITENPVNSEYLNHLIVRK